MKDNNQQVDLSKVSTEDLQKLLQQKQAAERTEREQKKKEYEKTKDDLIEALGATALVISDEMSAFKDDAIKRVRDFYQLMQDYGDVRNGKANKGNFEIKNDRFKVQYSSQIKMAFDERSILAEQKLKNFLGSFVKKRDKDLHALVLGLLERNASGDLDISNIQRLYQLEDRFDNEDWKEAIRLFKESYVSVGTAYYVRFYERNPETNQWNLINLNFASIQ